MISIIKYDILSSLSPTSKLYFVRIVQVIRSLLYLLSLLLPHVLLQRRYPHIPPHLLIPHLPLGYFGANIFFPAHDFVDAGLFGSPDIIADDIEFFCLA